MVVVYAIKVTYTMVALCSLIPYIFLCILVPYLSHIPEIERDPKNPRDFYFYQ